MKDVKSLEELHTSLLEDKAVLTYFSHNACNVCKDVKPKLNNALIEQYPEIKRLYIDVELHPEIAGHYSIFTTPAVLIFFDGAESYRKARSFGIGEIMDYIGRPYFLLYG